MPPHTVDPRRHRRAPSRHNSAPTASQADLTRLTQACVTLRADLYTTLATLLAEPGDGAPIGTIGRHAPEGSEPWRGEAAAVYWRVHFGARRLENAMRRDVNLPRRDPPRGGSANNTLSALEAISRMGSVVCAGTLISAADVVDGWVTAARRIRDIDEAEHWTPVPRVPGALPPACPYCHTFSLRMNLARAEVRCSNPECADAEGRRPRARMEQGRLNGAMLVFGDSTVVYFAPQQATPG